LTRVQLFVVDNAVKPRGINAYMRVSLKAMNIMKIISERWIWGIFWCEWCFIM